MPQKPFTITRVPKPRPDAAASKPAGQTTPPNASPCPACGALVADTALHSAHHDRTDKWATRVNEVLRAVVTSLRTPNPVPETDNPATESENPND